MLKGRSKCLEIDNSTKSTSKPSFSSNNTHRPQPLSCVRCTELIFESQVRRQRFWGCTHNITPIQIARGIACHPHNCSLQLAGMSQATHWHVLDPILLNMLTFLCKEVDYQVCFHIPWAQAIDSNAFGRPLQSVHVSD